MQLNFQPYSPKYAAKPNFKSDITFDIGGSQREGSCKIRYSATNTGEEFYTDRTSVNELGRTKFIDSNEFIDLIVNKNKSVQKSCKGVVREKGYKPNENTLQNVAIFLPSYTHDNMVFYFPNLKNDYGKPLEDIDFNNFGERLKAAGVQVSPNMKFKVVQDAMGTGLAMTQRLYDNDMLKEGSLYSTCITGGGCAISDIECIDNDHIIIKSSGSALLPRADEMEKVSAAGASAPSLAKNFCRSMGLSNEIIDDIITCNKAEFALSPVVEYEHNVKTDRLKTMLLETNKFELKDDNKKTFSIKVKDEYMNEYHRSRQYAIQKYCTAIARLGAIKRTQGSNGLIVTGTLAKAVDNTMRKEYNYSLSEQITGILTGSFNSSELSKLQKVYDFKILCDDRFFIDNNTECGDLIHKAKRIPNRSNWLRLTMKDLGESEGKTEDIGYAEVCESIINK